MCFPSTVFPQLPRTHSLGWNAVLFVHILVVFLYYEYYRYRYKI